MALPDFFVAGVPKAGTTALHSALARHPALYMSAVKEPKYFLTDGPPPTEGGPGDAKTYREHVWRREDYEALFAAAPPGALKGESTPFYLYSQDAQRRIRALIPDAKMIVVLRDPVERAHSNWTHLWSAGLDPIGDFLQACAREEDRAAAGWADFWRYTGLGMYGQQLAHLYSVFPPGQVLVFRYRALLTDPRYTLDRVCEFLRVRTGLLTSLPRENVTVQPHPTFRHSVVATARRLNAALTSVLPGDLGTGMADRLEHMLQQDAAPRRPLTWQQREALIPRFEADVALLESITGEDFSDWLQPRGDSGGLVGARPSGQRQARNGRPRQFLRSPNRRGQRDQCPARPASGVVGLASAAATGRAWRTPEDLWAQKTPGSPATARQHPSATRPESQRHSARRPATHRSTDIRAQKTPRAARQHPSATGPDRLPWAAQPTSHGKSAIPRPVCPFCGREIRGKPSSPCWRPPCARKLSGLAPVYVLGQSLDDLDEAASCLAAPRTQARPLGETGHSRYATPSSAARSYLPDR